MIYYCQNLSWTHKYPLGLRFSTHFCFWVSDWDGMDLSFKKLLRLSLFASSFSWKTFAQKSKLAEFTFAKSAISWVLEQILWRIFWQAQFFSKVKKYLFDCSPNSYQLQQLLILMVLLISSYISFNSFNLILWFCFFVV